MASAGSGVRMVVNNLRDALVVIPSLHKRWSGINSVIWTTTPAIAATMPTAAIGYHFPPGITALPFRQLLSQGWSRPAGARLRVWHARRNNDMIIGVLLRDVLRQPWALVFTREGRGSSGRFTRFLLGRMDHIIATSRPALPRDGEPASVIPHGVDMARFHPAPDRAAAWAETSLPGTRGIGVFGRIRPNKGTDLFVDAMIALLPQHPGWTAVVTGEAVGEENQRFLDAMKARVAAAGLAERIHFLGLLEGARMPALFRAISIYVAPQRREEFGLTPLEAMASGTAVVATRTGAAPDLVRDGITGTLVPPDDGTALQAALHPLLAEPARAEAMGAEGRRIALAEHSAEAENAAVAALYRELSA